MVGLWRGLENANLPWHLVQKVLLCEDRRISSGTDDSPGIRYLFCDLSRVRECSSRYPFCRTALSLNRVCSSFDTETFPAFSWWTVVTWVTSVTLSTTSTVPRCWLWAAICPLKLVGYFSPAQTILAIFPLHDLHSARPAAGASLGRAPILGFREGSSDWISVPRDRLVVWSVHEEDVDGLLRSLSSRILDFPS